MSWLATEAALLAVSMEVVRFASGDVALEGSLLLPEGAAPSAPVPAALLVAGDDVKLRAIEDEARGLAERGIAVLTTNARGARGSGGDVLLADFRDLAHDAQAGIEHLRARSEIDSARIAIVAIGRQGGWVAVLADSLSPRVASLVRIGTAEVPPEANSRWRLVRDMQAAKYSSDTIRAFAGLHPRLLEALVRRETRPAVLAAIDSTLASGEAKRAYKKGWLREWIHWIRDDDLPPIDRMQVEPWIRDHAFDPSPLTCASPTPSLFVLRAVEPDVLVDESANRVRDSMDFCSGVTGEVLILPNEESDLDCAAAWVIDHRLAPVPTPAPAPR